MEAAACAQPAFAGPVYSRREPEKTALYKVMQEHLLTFEQQWSDETSGRTLPKFVTEELRKYMDCGILGRGFALSAAIIPVEDRARLERPPGLVAGRAGQRRSWVEVRRNLVCDRAGAGSGRTNRVPRLPGTVLRRSVSGDPCVVLVMEPAEDRSRNNVLRRDSSHGRPGYRISWACRCM